MQMPLIILVSAAIAPSQLSPVQTPPKPNFATHVDYLSWYRQQLEFAAKDNAFEHYKLFLEGTGSQPAPDLPAERGSDAAHELAAIIKYPQPWPSEKYRAANSWIEQIDAAQVDALLEGNKQQNYAIAIKPDWSSLSDVVLPKLANGRAIGQMLCARSWRVQGKGIHVHAFVDALGANMALTHHLNQGLTVEEQMLASGQRSFIYEWIKACVPLRLPGAHDWQQIRDMLAQHDAAPITEGLARSTFYSQASAYEQIQRFAKPKSENGTEAGWRIDLTAFRASFADRPIATHPRREVINALESADPGDLAEAARAYFEGLREILNSGDGRDLEVRLQQLTASSLDAAPGVKAFVHPQDMLVTLSYRNEAMRRITHVYVNLLCPHLEREGWPASIDSVACPDVAACRMDPYSGGDLLIRKAKGARLVYSVGPDGKDNGGDPAKDVVLQVWPGR